jgi:hypothetical protein
MGHRPRHTRTIDEGSILQPLVPMKSSQIKVGGLYVCKGNDFAREVVQEVDSGDFYWRSYVLSTGKLTGEARVCSKRRLGLWADREATEEEVARCRVHQADALAPDSPSRTFVNTIYDLALRGVSDEKLLAEVERRGLK